MSRLNRKHTPDAPMKMWLADAMEDDVAEALRRLRRTRDVQRVAVMPDVHLSRDVCVGTAFATEHLIYPTAIGGDIGCGYAAVALSADGASLNGSAADRLLDRLREVVRIHRRRTLLEHRWLTAAQLSCPSLEHLKLRNGAFELGTLGRGNHFLEFQEDLANGRLWVMVHSGSRCMGQAILAHHLGRADGSSFGLRHLDANADTGRAYLGDMAWARGYAAISRLAMLRAACEAAREVIGAHPDWSTLINRDHNHIVRERLGNRSWFVHRKGAARARSGEPGIIPGSMSASTFHTIGRGVSDSLHSSSHGAGRVMSRSQAQRQVSAESLRTQLREVRFDERLAMGLRDECPAAYRDVGRVLRAQRELVRIVRELRPRISFKGV